MNVFECIAARRSVRDFEKKKIPELAIQKILSAAVAAPSAKHVLPWHFVLIENEAKLHELSDFVLKKYGADKGFAARIAFLKGKTVFHDAPLVVLVVCDENASKWVKEDAALAAENAFLAARALGIGSCFIGMANVLNDEESVLRGLGLSSGFKIFAALAFGFPKDAKWPKGEKREIKIIKRFP
ncbi:MAG: nitroreductase family protein [Candidatus Micrarchaeota archaeon]